MKILLLGHQRSGSSNLARFIAAALDMKLGLESFNAKKLKVLDIDSRYMSKEIYQEFIETQAANADIVKHIYGSFPHIVDQIVLEARAFEKIVFLHRVNLIDSALSASIAKNNGHWGKVPTPNYADMTIDLAFFKKRFLVYKNCIQAMQRTLEQSGISYIDLEYESIFPENVKSQREKAHELLEQLSNEVIDEDKYEMAYAKFLSSDVKINDKEKYAEFKNWQEVQALIDRLE